MRSLQRRKQDVWFCTSTRDDSEQEIRLNYSKPEMHKVTVSNTSGTPHELPVGIVAEYTRYIVVFDRDFKPTEGMLLFVDITPQLTSTGKLATDVNGVPYTQPDYVLSHVMDTKKGTIARYGIRKIAGNG
jgi:hypothetical protein